MPTGSHSEQQLCISALPPSTGSSIPVTKLASSLARKAAALPTSSGVATLPIGILFMITALPSSESVPPSTEAIMPVSAAKGHIAFTRTLSLANSAARPTKAVISQRNRWLNCGSYRSPLVTALTAPLLPAYQTRFGRGRGAEMELIFTKTPLRCC